MKAKNQIIQFATGIRTFGIMTVIVGCLLGIDPVKALNESAESSFGPTEVAAAPSAATIVVNGGGQAAVSKAISQAKPGDTIVVKAGNYDDNDPGVPLKITKSGTANAPITLLGENRPRLGNIKFVDANYFILDGFEVAYQTTTSLFHGVIVNNSKNITIRNMLIHHLTGSGVTAVKASDNLIVENSEIYEIIPHKNGTGAHCFINIDGAKNVTFRGNKCHDYIGDGFHALKPSGGTGLFDRGTTMIEGNIFFNSLAKAPCAENAIDLKAEAGEVIIRSNIMYGFQPLTGEGCQLQASGDPVGTAITAHADSNGTLIIESNEFYNMYAAVSNNDMDTTIRNNIFHDFKEGMPLWSTSKHIGVILANSNTKIYHNTFVNIPFIFHEYAPGGQKVINNLFQNIAGKINKAIPGSYQSNAWFNVHSSQLVSGSKDVTSNPGIDLNPTNSLLDYSLAVNSPLIDRGQPGLNVTTDFTNTPNIRVLNSPPDIGAFEYSDTSSAVMAVSFSLPIPEPTDEPTPEPTDEPTAEPTPEGVVLAINGPDSIAVGETAPLSVEVEGVSGNGLYGAQLEINFDPTLLSVDNLQVNPDLSFVLQNSADNTLGKIRLVASRQGHVPGLTGDVNLITFEVTAIGGANTTTLGFDNVKMGDPQAIPLTLTIENFTLLIDDETTPEPTDEPTPEPTDEPTPEPTDEPTPEPTDEPTPEPTDEPTNAVVFGQVILAGRAHNDWSGSAVTIDDTGHSASTDANGNFAIADVVSGPHSSITADAPGYLPAVCTEVTISTPETALTTINLLSGDINDDDVADVADATAIGVSFGQTGSALPSDINHDGIIDIFDLILVSVNFGQEAQVWDCLVE